MAIKITPSNYRRNLKISGKTKQRNLLIHDVYKLGVSIEKIAKKFQLSPATVENIVKSRRENFTR